MLLSIFLPALLSLLSFTGQASAAESLRITADQHSFGGVNYPQLQFFTTKHREDTIKEIVRSGARVIRLFSKYFPRGWALGVGLVRSADGE